MTEVVTIPVDGGSGLHLHLEASERLQGLPYAVNAETGYACLRGGLGTGSWTIPESAEVEALADQMRSRQDGLWLAMVDFPGQKRLCLVQTNRGPFYEDNFGDTDHTSNRGWRDFYARAGYFLADHAAQEWGESAIVVDHVTGHGWPSEVTTAFIDGLRSWAALNPETKLSDVYFVGNDSCGMRSPAQIADAFETLSSYDAGWVDVQTSNGAPSSFGFEVPRIDEHVVMYKIDVKTHVE